MNRVSAVVLTHNEEKNLSDCLNSLNWCDELIVIDDFSSDKTRAIAKNLGAKVYQRHLKGDFSLQRNFGLKKAKGEWLFFVDADEIVPAALAREIKERIEKQPKVNGFYLKRKTKFLGQWLGHGEAAGSRFLRIARKGAGFWQGKVHEIWRIKGKKETLKTLLFHEQSVSLIDFAKRINFYSTLRSQELFEKKQNFSLFQLLSYPLLKFFKNFFLKLGFLDGIPGLILSILMSFHSFLVRVKLFMLYKAKKTMRGFYLIGLPLAFLILSLPFGQLTRAVFLSPEVHLYLHDFFTFLLIILFLYLERPKINFFYTSRVGGYILFFFLISIFSLLVNLPDHNPRQLLIASLYPLRWLGYAFIYGIGLWFFKKFPELRKNYFKLLIYSSLTLASLGLFQYFLFPDFRPFEVYHWDPHYYRLVATFFDPGFTGIILALSLILLLDFYWQDFKKFKPKPVVLVFLILYLALVLTYSRSSYLAYLLGLLYYTIRNKNIKFFVFSLLFFFLTIFFLPRPGGEGVRLERTTSSWARLANLKEGLKIFEKNPIFGVGFNNLRYVKKELGFVGEDWQESHSASGLDSSLLFVLVTTGISGTFIYLRLLKKIFQQDSGLIKASVAALMIHSLFNNTLFYPWAMIWLWLILALEETGGGG